MCHKSFHFLLNWRTFQSHPKNNLMFTKLLQLEALGIHIIILLLYKSKTYLRVHLEKTFIFTVFKKALNACGNNFFAFVSNRQPTKEPSKVLQLPSFSCSVCTKSFHFFISLKLHFKVYSRKNVHFYSFFGLSGPVWSKSTHF